MEVVCSKSYSTSVADDRLMKNVLCESHTRTLCRSQYVPRQCPQTRARLCNLRNSKLFPKRRQVICGLTLRVNLLEENVTSGCHGIMVHLLSSADPGICQPISARPGALPVALLGISSPAAAGSHNSFQPHQLTVPILHWRPIHDQIGKQLSQALAVDKGSSLQRLPHPSPTLGLSDATSLVHLFLHLVSPSRVKHSFCLFHTPFCHHTVLNSLSAHLYHPVAYPGGYHDFLCTLRHQQESGI